MFGNAFAEAISNEFSNLLNVLDARTPFKELVHNDIMEKCGLLQKYSDLSEDEQDNREEIAQFQLEEEQEKRKEELQSLLVSSIQGSSDLDNKRASPMKQIAFGLITDSGNWLEEEEA